MKKFRKQVAGLSAVCLLSLLLSSCLKNSPTYYAPPVALVSFFQASPDQPSLNLYFNTDEVNVGPISYGTGVGYFRAYTGLRTVNLYTYGAMGQVFTDTITLQANQVYSLFMANTPAKPDLVALKDTINQPAANTASIRFIDLSPDAPAVDLALNDTVKISNRSYKGYSTFIPVTGNKSYTLAVTQHGTTTALATLAAVTLNVGNVYTVIFTGLVNGTTSTDKPIIYCVTNAYY